jgi:hypothetical protein
LIRISLCTGLKYLELNHGEVVLPNGMRVLKDNRSEEKNLKQTIEKWDKEIFEYHDEFKEFFDLELFDDDSDERRIPRI